MPSASPDGSTPQAVFARVVASVERARLRDELEVSTIPAPTGLAPFAHALAADVNPARHADDSDLGTGRLVILYDPDSPDGWGGPVRVICYAQAPLETEIGLDPFVTDVAWSWLVDALATRGAQYTAASGTATKVLSTGYGELAGQGSGAQIELRASWTPLELDLSSHVEGWAELLCMVAGYPPAADGVAVLPPRRGSRG
ncbi:DUF3000 family protein [Microcella frigidaquae]|uniref:DUF3000 domain-containing protein n=1 Tax=Microcella frigidaquae TaxID=424758 RepID=A0A840X2N7_9MICO|nr:hypothetical protein [Microcella frigidaquae]NHN43928.1 DUF3000 family protein [Microcella frigidaquae]